MKDYDKYDHILGDKLSGLREEPPADMFDRIEATLAAMAAAEGESAESAREEQPKVVPLWRGGLWRTIGMSVAAAAVAVAVMVGVRLEAPEVFAPVELASMPHLSAPTRLTTPSLPTPIENRVAAIAPAESQLIASHTPLTTATPEVEVLKSTTSEADDNQSTLEQSAPKSRTSTHRKSRRNRSRQEVESLENYWRENLEQESSGGINLLRPSEIAVVATNVGFNNSDHISANIAQSQMVASERHNLGGTYVNPLLQSQQQSAELKHFMPTTFGLSLGYTLSDYISIHTGLQFTFLHSESQTEAAVSRYEHRRSMDYVGIPIGLAIDLVEYNSFGLYTSLGIAADLNISATDGFYVDGSIVRTDALDVPLITLSAEALFGLEYNFWGNLGLYGEVGCTYRAINRENYPESYFTLHPFSFATRFGLRWSFN